MNDLKGDVIEESLQDKRILKELTIISTRFEKVTKAHRTPWLKQWTLHTISVPEKKATKLAERLSHTLEPHHWYIDYKNKSTHYIIFPDKIFKVNRSKTSEYKPVVTYGLSINIPRHQLDFSPDITNWERTDK